MADFRLGGHRMILSWPHNPFCACNPLDTGGAANGAGKDRFEIDTEKFESFHGSQPVRSLRRRFPALENARHFRRLARRAESLPRERAGLRRSFFAEKPSGAADPYEKWRDDLQCAHAKAWEQPSQTADTLVLDDPRAEGRHLRATAGLAESLIAKVQQDHFHEREADLAFLDRFLGPGVVTEGAQQFRWALVTGPAGAGKTRLAVQFLKNAEKQGFRAGFLKLESLREFDARGWRPSHPTFVVIDYAAESPDLVGKMLKGFTAIVCGASFEYPVRVLLLEREATGDWFKTIAPTDSSGALMRNFCYRENETRWDYSLTPLSSKALLTIMRGRLPGGGTDLPDELLLDTLNRIDLPSTGHHWHSAPRPLFAAATALKIADMMEGGEDATTVIVNLRAHSDGIELPRRHGRTWRAHPRLSYGAPGGDTEMAITGSATTSQNWLNIPGNRSKLSNLQRDDVLAWIIDRERAHFWFDGDAPDRRTEKRRLEIHENLLLVATMALDISRQRYDVETPDGSR